MPCSNKFLIDEFLHSKNTIACYGIALEVLVLNQSKLVSIDFI